MAITRTEIGGHETLSLSGAVLTLTDVDIGDDVAKIVVLKISCDSGGATNPISSATLDTGGGAVAADGFVSGSGGNNAAAFEAWWEVSGGEEGTFAITFSSTANRFLAAQVVQLVGADLPPEDSDAVNSNQPSSSVSIDVVDGGQTEVVSAQRRASSAYELDATTGWTLDAYYHGTTNCSGGFGTSAETADVSGKTFVGDWTGDNPDDTSIAAVCFPPAAGSGDELDGQNIESSSDITDPDIGQNHALSAGNVESLSDMTDPTLSIENLDELTGADAEANSDMTDPNISQVHALSVNNLESLSDMVDPSLTSDSTDDLTGADIESLSDITDPSISQNHVLSADEAISLSDVTDPNIGQVHALSANDIEADSEFSEVYLQAEVNPDDIEANSDMTDPSIGQNHMLSASNLESLSEFDLTYIGNPVTIIPQSMGYY